MAIVWYSSTLAQYYEVESPVFNSSDINSSDAGVTLVRQLSMRAIAFQ